MTSFIVDINVVVIDWSRVACGIYTSSFSLIGIGALCSTLACRFLGFRKRVDILTSACRQRSVVRLTVAISPLLSSLVGAGR